MVFTQPSTQNWSRAFTVWIDGIQVVFPGQVVVRVIRGGFLRRVRTATRAVSAVITVFFSLYCTRPLSALTHQKTLPAVKVAPMYPMSGMFGTGRGASVEETGMASWYGDGDGFEELDGRSAG